MIIKINKQALKIGFIYVLILLVVGALCYSVGYYAGFTYSGDFYIEQMESCICNLN